MLLEVILCRKEGRRLRKADWPAPVLGHLLVRDSPAASNNFKRNIRYAELKASKDAYATASINVLPPIFEPELLPSPDGALLIRGIELSVFNEEIYEHEQLWLCRPK